MIIKIAVIGVICAILCLVIKQYRPDLSVILQISGIIAIIVASLSFFSDFKSDAQELTAFSSLIEDGYIKLLIKVLSIAILTKLSTDICDDTGNSALSTSVELIGKVIILAMCMPLLKMLAQIAEGLLV